MRKKLTPKLIDNLPLPLGKRYEVRDELVVGLLVRVSASGGKVWYTACRIKGKARRIRIGTYPILSLADARERARELLRDVQLGKFDEDHRDAPTFGEIVPQFVELYAKPRNRSWKSTERVLTKFAELNHKPIDEMRRGHVVAILDRMTAAGTTVGANRALAAVKTLAVLQRIPEVLGERTFAEAEEAGHPDTHALVRIDGCLRDGFEETVSRILSVETYSVISE